MDDPLFQEARAAHAKGLSPAAIACALFDPKNPYYSSHRVVHALFRKEGLGLPLPQVAHALSSHHGLCFTSCQVATLLVSPHGLGLPITQVARVLYDGQGMALPPTQVARALYTVIGLYPQVAAQVMGLSSSECLSLAPPRVDKVLRARGGWSPAIHLVAWCLHTEAGLALPLEQVAKALASPKGLGLPPTKVAKELSCLGCFSLPQGTVSKVLADPHGLGLSPHTVAKVLASEDGLHLAPPCVARALHSRDGLALPADAVAKALHADDGCGFSVRDTAAALADRRGLGLTPDALFPALLAVIKDPRALLQTILPLLFGPSTNKDRAAMVEALFPCLTSSHPLPFLVRAFLDKDGLGWSAQEVVSFFHAKDGLDLPPHTIVYALTHPTGPCFPVDQVASLLYSCQGLGLPYPLVREGLVFGTGMNEASASALLSRLDATKDGLCLSLDRGSRAPSRPLPVAHGSSLWR